MSESKHTPGFWEWSIRTSDKSPATLFVCDDCGDDTDIAAMLEDCDFDTQWANARLIAAAPDLLAACKAASEVHKLLLEAPELNMANYTEDGVSALNHAVNEACCKLEAIHAAITRAEQEQ